MTYLSGLKDFIKNWDDRFVEVSPDEVFRTSPQGNINTDGTAVCGDSPILSKYHRYFKKSIELGVRDLTVALILKLNCITYSSCQGHRATFDPLVGEHSRTIMRPRYVAILPRDEADLVRLSETLQILANLTNANFPDGPIQVTLETDLLESENNYTMPGLVLFFAPTIDDENAYFDQLDLVYQKFLELIH